MEQATIMESTTEQSTLKDEHESRTQNQSDQKVCDSKRLGVDSIARDTNSENASAIEDETTIKTQQCELPPCSTHANCEASETLILGKYKIEQCVWLTNVIQKQIHDNFAQPNVLLSSNSPAIIDWNAITEQLKETYNMEWHTSPCQKLWKYISYGYEDDASAANKNEGALHSSSDSEAYEEQEEYPKNINSIRECKKLKRKAQDPAEGKLSLFPTYDIPFSANDDELWAVDKRLSLAVTASQFLRKKKLPSSNLTTDSVATVNKTISSQSTSTLSPAPTTSHMSVSCASGIFRATPGSEVTRNEADDQAKQVKMQSKANATASPAVLANSQPTQKSGVAPPPLPKPLMTSFQFFCKMYGGNAAWKNRSEDEVSSEAALRKLFAEAPSDVLRACASMVEEDRRRFNREHLRRSLWEKAYFLDQVNIN